MSLWHETVLLAQEKNLLAYSSVSPSCMSYNTNDTRYLHLCPVSILVNKSAELFSDLICLVNFSPMATVMERMISYCIALLLKCRLYFWDVVNNWHVISIKIGGPRYWNTHHSQLILDLMQGFNSNFHCNKLWIKYWRFYGRLLLRVSVDKWHDHVDHEPGLTSSTTFVASIIAVYEQT